MSIATLAAWLVTASLGGYMLRTWIARGGLRHQRVTGIGAPPLVIFGHAGVALSGLALWVCYLATTWLPLAWVDVVVIGVAITLGICMVTMWTPYPIRDPHVEPEPPAAPPTVAEHEFNVTDELITRLLTEPIPRRRKQKLHLVPLIPVCHGFAALATFLLATLTAARAGAA